MTYWVRFTLRSGATRLIVTDSVIEAIMGLHHAGLCPISWEIINQYPDDDENT